MEIILNLAIKFWRHKAFPYALFILLLVLANYAPLPGDLTLTLIDRNSIGIPTAFLCFLIVVWIQQLPTTKAGHIGLVFAIRAETDSLHTRVSSDIVATTREALKLVPLTTPIQVIELSQEQSGNALDMQTAEAIRKKCRAHIVIFGEAKERKERGKEFYVLKLDGIVAHAPIAINESQALATEMNDILPLKNKIEHDNEITGFEITSLQMSEAIKFVIATAALLTGDGLLAIRLLESVNGNRAQLAIHGNIKSIQKLIQMLPSRLGNAYAFMSHVSHARWENSREPNDLKESIRWIEKHKLTVGESPEFYLIKAIEAFALKNNQQKAKDLINKCRAKYPSNPSWRYSAAFLSAIEGDTDSALIYYDSLASLETGHVLPFQVEGFIDWALSKEPTCNEFYFCLGYINERLKGDKVLASKHFNTYINGVHKNLKKSSRALKHSIDYLNKAT